MMAQQRNKSASVLCHAWQYLTWPGRTLTAPPPLGLGSASWIPIITYLLAFLRWIGIETHPNFPCDRCHQPMRWLQNSANLLIFQAQRSNAPLSGRQNFPQMPIGQSAVADSMACKIPTAHTPRTLKLPNPTRVPIHKAVSFTKFIPPPLLLSAHQPTHASWRFTFASRQRLDVQQPLAYLDIAAATK